MTFSRTRSLAQNEMSLKNTEEWKISIQFSNEIKSSQYNFMEYPLELIVPRINYLDINKLFQQQILILDNSIMFPFTLVTDEALLASNDIENSSNYEPTPSLEIVSKLTNLPNLSDNDIDENLNPNISSQYYTLRELSSLEVSNKDFALFHMNIRSLSLHYEELHALLTTANVEFQVIGLSEVTFSNPLKTPLYMVCKQFRFLVLNFGILSHYLYVLLALFQFFDQS